MGAREQQAVERLRKFAIERRHRLGFRQQDVADRSGLSLAWVGMLEVGRLKSVPRIDTLVKLADGLMLPSEAPGTLVNFLRLLVAGSLDGRVVRGVATGGQEAHVVLAQAIQEVGVAPLPGDQVDVSAALFLDQQLRSERLDRIFAMLKVDLTPDDCALAQLFLKRLYDEAPVPARERNASRRQPKAASGRR